MGKLDEEVPVGCIFCGGEAKVIHFDRNMWYVVCSNSCCKKHDHYAYLGSTKNNSIEQWNFANRPFQGRKGKKDAKDDNL